MIEKKHVDFLHCCQESHIGWAEYFEENPEIEKEYVATDEWDSAERHREFADQYQRTIDYIKNFESIVAKGVKI